MVQAFELQLAPVMLVKAGAAVYAQRVVEATKSKLRKANPDTEFITLDAASYEAHELDLRAAPSLFGEPKAVIVPNLEQLNNTCRDELLGYVESPDPQLSLLLVHHGGAKGKKLLELLERNSVPTVVVPDIKTQAEKLQAVRNEATLAKRAMRSDAASALVDALGSDVVELLSATRQLLSDVPGEITKEHVDRYFAGRIEARGFNIADAVARADIGSAVELTRHALATGVKPTGVISALDIKFRQMALVLGMRSSKLSVDIGLQPWQLNQAKRDVRIWSAAALAKAIEEIARADADVKGDSKDANFAVERALLAIGRAQRLS